MNPCCERSTGKNTTDPAEPVDESGSPISWGPDQGFDWYPKDTLMGDCHGFQSCLLIQCIPVVPVQPGKEPLEWNAHVPQHQISPGAHLLRMWIGLRIVEGRSYNTIYIGKLVTNCRNDIDVKVGESSNNGSHLSQLQNTISKLVTKKKHTFDFVILCTLCFRHCVIVILVVLNVFCLKSCVPNPSTQTESSRHFQTKLLSCSCASPPA